MLVCVCVVCSGWMTRVVSVCVCVCVCVCEPVPSPSTESELDQAVLQPVQYQYYSTVLLSQPGGPA